MGINAIPNPKKSIKVDFPLEKIKRSIKNIPILNKNYRFHNSNELFNQYTFESFEFLSAGVYLDFHLDSISENKTEINLEIRRKIGSFNQPSEITNANYHIDRLFKYIAELTSKSDEELELIKQKNNSKTVKSKPKKKGGCLKIGLIILAVFFGLFIIGALLTSNDSEKSTYNIQQDELFNEDLDCKEDYEDGDYTAKYKLLAEQLNSTYAVRTKKFEFQFRKGMKELHVIPILDNGMTNSENRKIFQTKFGGVIPRHLAFGLTNSKNEKGLFDIQFDSKSNSKKIVVVKYIFDDSNYCKRGVIYDILNHKGTEY